MRSGRSSRTCDGSSARRESIRATRASGRPRGCGSLVGPVAPGSLAASFDQAPQNLEHHNNSDLSQRDLLVEPGFLTSYGLGSLYAGRRRTVSISGQVSRGPGDRGDRRRWPGCSRRGGRTANAPVLKTGALTGLRVRIPPPPLYLTTSYGFHRIALTSSFSRVLPKLLPAPVNPSRFPASSK